MSDNEKKSGGFKTFIIALIIIAAVVCSGVFIAKCYYKKYVDNNANSDGNPVLLNRAATINDIQIEQSVEATLTNLKDSYLVVPNTEIKNLKITFVFYDKSSNVVCTHTEEVGNVNKSEKYTVSISHTLSDMFKINKVQYNVSGGTVSYFA